MHMLISLFTTKTHQFMYIYKMVLLHFWKFKP